MHGGLTHDQAAAVLRRAAELDARFAPPGEPDVDEEVLEQAAVEAGLSPQAVRRALAELRAGVLDEPPRRHRGVLGDPALTVVRAVPGRVDDVGRHLHRFLRDQLFELRRHRGLTTTWVRRRGLEAHARRALDHALNRRIVLREVHSVDLTVADGGDGSSIVRLVLDVAAVRHRQGTIAGATAVTGTGMALSTAAVADGGIVLLATGAGAGLAGLGLWAGGRLYRNRAGEIESGVNGMLDRLELAAGGHHRALGSR